MRVILVEARIRGVVLNCKVIGWWIGSSRVHFKQLTYVGQAGREAAGDRKIRRAVHANQVGRVALALRCSFHYWKKKYMSL